MNAGRDAPKARTTVQRARLELSHWAAIAAGLALLGLLAYSSRFRASTQPVATERGAAPARGATEEKRARSNGSSPHSAASGSPQLPTSLSGLVQTDRGTPIRSALVCAVSAGERCCAAEACVRSDAQGRFAVSRAMGATRLHAQASGYAPLVRDLSGATLGTDEGEPILLKMRAAPAEEVSNVLSGRVVDATGGAVADALVSASVDEAREALAATLSDGAGNFSLSVAGSSAQIEVRAAAYSWLSTRVSAPALGLQLVLLPASSIAGRVLIAGTEQLVRGVEVYASNSDGVGAARQTTTADDGSFDFEAVPAGQYELSVRDAAWSGEPSVVHVGVADASSDVKLEVTAAGRLHGLLRVGGQPCLDGLVDVRGSAWSSFAPGDAQGNVTLGSVPRGEYQLVASCARPNALPWSETLRIGAEPVERTWSLEAGLTLTGHVEDAEGKPVAGLPVEALPRDERARGATCASDETGSFQCTGLTAGPYEVRAGEVSRYGSEAVRVELGAADATPLVLRLRPTGSIRVSVSSAPGPPAPPLQVLARKAASLPITPLAHAGEFVFEGLSLGEYSVFVAPGGLDADGSVRVQLTRSNPVATVSLAAPSTEAIAGVVLDAAGEPIPDAWVRIEPSDPLVATLVSGIPPVLSRSHGEFEFAALTPGRYRLTATQGSDDAVRADITPGMRRVELRLSPHPQQGLAAELSAIR